MHSIPKKFARTLRKRNEINGRIDVKTILLKYAKLEIESGLPFDFDAVCYFNNSKPFVLLNGDIPEARQLFTLAHELGHIIMPGHKSIIACSPESIMNSNISNDELTEEDQFKIYDEISDYYKKEKEANEFASELFFPEERIKKLIFSGATFKQLLIMLINESKLSIQATTRAIMEYLRPGIVVKIEHTSYDGFYVFASKGTYFYGVSAYSLYRNKEQIRIVEENSVHTEVFYYYNYLVTCYSLFDEISISDNITVPNVKSTDILKNFLNNIHNTDETEKVFRRVNGIFAHVNSKKAIKNMSQDEYFQEIKNTFSKRQDLVYITKTIEFQQYINKRYEEMINK